MTYYKPPATDYSGDVVATLFGLFNTLFNLVIKWSVAVCVFMLVIVAFDHYPLISTGVSLALVLLVLRMMFRSPRR